MAPGSSNNQNNNANNNHNRQTGTKPKSKSSKKNSVPQEMVAPTRRDLQQQLNVLVDWATVSGASSVVQNNNTQQQQHYSSAAQPSTSGQQQQQQQGQNILLKPRNNRTPGEGTCYEIDNLSLQDNSRYIPVRPIVRRNLLNEGNSGEQNEPHNTAVGVVIPTTPNSSLQQTFRLSEGTFGGGVAVAGTGAYSWNINNLLHNNSGSLQAHGSSGPSGASGNATGVIPKQQQQQQHILNPLLLLQHQGQSGQSRSTSSPLSYRVPDGASQNQLNLNKNSNQQLHQQQQNHHLLTAAVPSTSTGSRYGSAAFAASHPLSSTIGGVAGTVEDTLNQIQEYIKLTTHLISSVQIDNLNGGPRPQSVQSVSTNQSTTPVPPSASCDELRYRMESQSKNMQALKEQQAHLLRLQQAARQQLQEMESMRQHHVATVAPPVESFQTVEQVQDGIGSIMERMRVLSTFIQNQQELSNMLGGDNEDVLSDQAMLQQKFQELRDKKSQMHNLVSELQNMNLDATRQFDGGEAAGEARTVPIELTHAPATPADARNATKTFMNGGGSTMEASSSGGAGSTSRVIPHRHLADESRNGHALEEDDEGPLNEEEATVLTGTADMLSEKINEINAMKSQLRRLKEMMDTVKLIEMKTGHESIDEEEEDGEEDAPEEEEEGEDDEDGEGGATAVIAMQHQPPQQRSRSRSMSSAPITLLPDGTTIPKNEADGNEMSNQERDQLNQRVEALQAMTHDLREQAKSIAAERDRLKHARNDLQKRRNNVVELQQQTQTNEKLTNQVASFVSLADSGVTRGPKERQQMGLKAELEHKRRELDRIEKMTQNIKKNADLSRASVVSVEGCPHDIVTEVGTAGPSAASLQQGIVKPPTVAAGPSSIVSSMDSCSDGDRGSHHRGTTSVHPIIPPPPAPSAISGSLQNNTAGSNATNDSKTNSADSGVTSDIFAHAQLESASYQSSSTRSFPPPMPDICNRNAAGDRYRAKRGGGGGSADVDAEGVAVAASAAAAAAAADIRDHTSPWPVFGPGLGAGMSSSNTGPHSPHYGHPVYGVMHDLSHHTAVGYGGAYGSSWSTGGGPYGGAANLLPPHAATPNTPPDPIVLQHIMQTQQMLMNSIMQCNQLLWIQQREINNLNNAVLLLQERILGTNSSLLLHEGHVPSVAASLIRAESTPPNNGSNMNMSNAATSGSSIYARARSEQPMMSQHQQQQISPHHHYSHNPHVHSSSHLSAAGILQQQSQQSQQSQHPMQSFNTHNQPSPYGPLSNAMTQTHSIMSPQLLAGPSGTTPAAPQPAQCTVNQQIQRNNTNISQIGLPPSGRAFRSGVRPLNINTLNNALYDDQATGMANNNVLNASAVTSANETAAAGGLLNAYGGALSHMATAPNMINNLCNSSQPTTPTLGTGGAMLPQQSARFGHNFNNLNNNVTNNLSNANTAVVNNMQQQHATQQNNLYNQQQDSPSQQQQQTQALNNQVLPGVRANNYWDNFRSYSRQNLLSSNSCKSNEESGSYSGGSGGGGSAGGAGGTGGSGCNTINNQLQRNNSNAANQYMNNQSNKYQQAINITRNNSLSNTNQMNNAVAGLGPEMGAGTSQQLMSYQHQQQQQGQTGDDACGQAVDQHQHHQQEPPHHGGHLQAGPPALMRGHQEPFPSQHHQQTQQPHQQAAMQQVVGTSSLQPQSHHAYPHQQLQQHPQQPIEHHQQQYPPISQTGVAGALGTGHNQHAQQHQPQHTPLSQSNSLDLGELQFHTNPINLGLANKTHPKASGHKKYPLSLRSCRDAGAGGEGSSGCYVSGGGDMNLASACTYQHDSKSTSKLFEALKENVYQEVKNLITANESRPHFLIQLFRELQLISSDPLRQRTLQSIQELYNRYIESTLQEENHVNNVGSNNLLTSSGTSLSEGGSAGGVDGGGRTMADGLEIGRLEPQNSSPQQERNVDSAVELEVVQNYTNLRQQQQQQQQYHFAAAPPESNTISSSSAVGSQQPLGDVVTSTPNHPSSSLAARGNQEQLVPLAVANSEIINIIMGDIVAVINSVDYINDSVLFKIAGVICNHAAGGNANGAANVGDYAHQIVEGANTSTSGGGQQQHHHHHHHQHHYHHHHPAQAARAPGPPAAANSLLVAASFLSTHSDHDQAGGGGAGGDLFSREDFLRHLETWNRTDKDEFISNLENFLNNILLRSSAGEGEGEQEEDAIEGAIATSGVGVQQPTLPSAYSDAVQSEASGFTANCAVPSEAFGGTQGSGRVSRPGVCVGDGNPFLEDHHPQESSLEVSSSSAANGYSSTTYDLAEADQVCDMDSSSGSQQGSRVVAGAPPGNVPSTSVASLPVGPSIEHSLGHTAELSTTFDDRWTVVVQKKLVALPDEEQPTATVGSNSSGSGGVDTRQQRIPHQQPVHQLHPARPSSATSGASPGTSAGGGNNGNNINNNWQSEEVADEHLEHTEEHSSYY